NLLVQVENFNYRPTLYFQDNNFVAFHAIELNQYKNYTKKSFSSISEVLDKYYREKDIYHRINQKSQSIRKILQIQLERSKNKLEKRKDKIKKAKNRDIYKVYGDLISANIYKIQKGDQSIEIENYYDENKAKENIPLDPNITTSKN